LQRPTLGTTGNTFGAHINKDPAEAGAAGDETALKPDLDIDPRVAVGSVFNFAPAFCESVAPAHHRGLGW